MMIYDAKNINCYFKILLLKFVISYTEKELSIQLPVPKLNFIYTLLLLFSEIILKRTCNAFDSLNDEQYKYDEN